MGWLSKECKYYTRFSLLKRRLQCMHQDNPTFRCGFHWFNWRMCPLMRDYFRALKKDSKILSMAQEGSNQQVQREEIREVVAEKDALAEEIKELFDNDE